MRVIEFKTKKSNQSIYIPKKFQAELKDAVGKNVRVIILLDEPDSNEDLTINEQFLKGSADSNSIYDNY